MLDEQSAFKDTPDDIFDRMLLTAFQDEEKLIRFLNGKEKMEFIRCYTDLLSQLSHLKLQQAQWDYYLQIGQTQHIWTNRVPKHVAEKNSMVHTFGRSKGMIGQRRIQIQVKLQHTKKMLSHFEQQMSFQLVSDVDFASEMSSISAILKAFVEQNQKQIRSELEYKREMLILDATDHRLVRAFFDLKPKKRQVRTEQIHFVSSDETISFTVMRSRYSQQDVCGKRP